MSWPPYSAGARMHTSDAPPTRKSISALGDVNPVGPHHRITNSGSLQAFQTSPTGASSSRVTRTSNVSVLSSVFLSCTDTNPFQSAVSADAALWRQDLAGERPAGDVHKRAGDGTGLLGGKERGGRAELGQGGRAARHAHLVQVLEYAPVGRLVQLATHVRGHLLPGERLWKP